MERLIDVGGWSLRNLGRGPVFLPTGTREREASSSLLPTCAPWFPTAPPVGLDCRMTGLR